jgi:hypothetical protein
MAAQVAIAACTCASRELLDVLLFFGYNVQPVIMVSQSPWSRKRCAAARFNTHKRLLTRVRSKVGL